MFQRTRHGARTYLLLVLAAPFAISSVSGCQHDTTTVFPPGLKPVAVDTVAPPSADGGDAYPEELSPLVQGHDDGGNFDYVFATGYVAASVESVWAAFKLPNVIVDRHSIDSYTVTQNVEKGYDVSFLTTYSRKAGTYNVIFDVTWREGVVEGTEASPSQVSVVYEKTHGSSFVDLMVGSIELVAVTPTVTELKFAQRLRGMTTDSTTIASWTNALFASVVAQVHGKPLP